MIAPAGEADSDSAFAQKCLLDMQDLQAEVYRAREQLKLARLDAEESYARVLDLESELRLEQAGFAALQKQAHDIGENLRQVLATHAQDNARWKQELDRVHAAHLDDNARWQHELERVHQTHEQARLERQYLEESVALRAELERRQARHDQDNAVWQSEVSRVQALHEADNTVWRAEVERLNGELAQLADAWRLERDAALAPASVGQKGAARGPGAGSAGGR